MICWLSPEPVYLEGDGSIDRLGKRITDKYYDSYRLARKNRTSTAYTAI